MKLIASTIASALLMLQFMFAVPADAQQEPALKVVTGTEMIADIVKDLLGAENISVLTLVPAASCPGHHDMQASDMAFISNADLLILHEWQQEQPAIDGALKAARKTYTPFYVQGKNSLLVPGNQIKASRDIAGILAELYPDKAEIIHNRLEQRISRISTLANDYQTKLQPFAQTPALVTEMQAEFATWAGMHVLETYGRAEDISPLELIRLTDSGKKNNVKIIIDNLQTGAETGVPLANEINAQHITFSNFPNINPLMPTYEDLLQSNCELLLQALRKNSPEPPLTRTKNS